MTKQNLCWCVQERMILNMLLLKSWRCFRLHFADHNNRVSSFSTQKYTICKNVKFCWRYATNRSHLALEKRIFYLAQSTQIWKGISALLSIGTIKALRWMLILRLLQLLYISNTKRKPCCFLRHFIFLNSSSKACKFQYWFQVLPHFLIFYKFDSDVCWLVS